jgi:hypothetical protein
MVDRLDEERLETLRVWGSGLATESREELRAAGRAIVMLIEEIDRLQVDVWQARDAESSSLAGQGDENEPLEALSSQSLGESLRERLGVMVPGRATDDREDG